MAISIEKGLLAVEDVAWDDTGSGSTFPRKTSSGAFKTFRRVNGSHVPLLTATRAKTLADNSTTPGNTVDAAISAICISITSIGVPDDSTLENSSGTLQVKALGVDTAQLAGDSVDGTKIADDSIDSEHYVDGSIDLQHLAADSVNASKIVDGSVDTAELADGAVETIKIADDNVTYSKLNADGNGNTDTHFIYAAGTHTHSGGVASTSTVFVSSMLSTDLVMVTFKSVAGSIQVRQALPADGQFVVTASGNFVNNDTIMYQVLRAVTT